jgi:hypothetical protein
MEAAAMNSQSLFALSADLRTHSEPNPDLLRLQGWSIISADGPYCTAWKGSVEVLLVWQQGRWLKLNGGDPES